MAEAIARDVVEAFYKAYAVRDAAMVAPFLHDDVEWVINGPVDVLPFCGLRRGKQAVIAHINDAAPNILRVFSFVTELMLVDGDRAATLNRLAGHHGSDGRVISYRLAHFMRFEDGKLIENLSFIDTYDAVEQVLGHPLAPVEAHPIDTDDLIAL